MKDQAGRRSREKGRNAEQMLMGAGVLCLELCSFFDQAVFHISGVGECIMFVKSSLPSDKEPVGTGTPQISRALPAERLEVR